MEIKVELEKEEKKGPDEWEIKDAAQTLLRAEEIKADKDLMDKVKPVLSKKVKALKSIESFAELKEVAKKRIKELDKEDSE